MNKIFLCFQSRKLCSIFICICIVFSSSLLYSQYPFEKYKQIKYKEYKKWKFKAVQKKLANMNYSISVKNFFGDGESVTVQLTGFCDSTNDLYSNYDYSYIRIFKNKKEIQKFKESYGFGGDLNKPQSLIVEDINSDGLKDIKILIPYYGCGGYNYYPRVIYLIQQKDGCFKKFSFRDYMFDFINRPEIDFDGDGKYKVITQTFVNYKNHNYWSFNIYEFNGDCLVNVNKKYDYTILVQLLFQDNYEVTDKMTREQMKQFARKLPVEYNQK